jgi:hypothetical protein
LFFLFFCGGRLRASGADLNENTPIYKSPSDCFYYFFVAEDSAPAVSVQKSVVQKQGDSGSGDAMRRPATRDFFIFLWRKTPRQRETTLPAIIFLFFEMK